MAQTGRRLDGEPAHDGTLSNLPALRVQHGGAIRVHQRGLWGLLVPLCQPVVRAPLSRAGAKGVRPLCRAAQEGGVNDVIVFAAGALIGAMGGFAMGHIFGWRAGREERANKDIVVTFTPPTEIPAEMVRPYIPRAGEPIVPPSTISWCSTPARESPATPASQVKSEQ